MSQMSTIILTCEMMGKLVEVVVAVKLTREVILKLLYGAAVSSEVPAGLQKPLRSVDGEFCFQMCLWGLLQPSKNKIKAFKKFILSARNTKSTSYHTTHIKGVWHVYL
jgi:hypothetical protein